VIRPGCVTDEQVDEILLRRASGQKQREIADALGVSHDAVQRAIARAAKTGRLGFTPVLDGFEISKITTKQDDGSYITQRPEPPEAEFELPEGHILERTSLKVGDSWYKTKLVSAETQLTREAIIEAVAEWRGRSEILLAPRGCDATRLALYPAADLHLGLLAWGKDSERDWDLDIAQREITAAVSELIQLTPATQTAVMLDLGDQFHMNDQTNATPMHKHRLDVDGRFPKVAKAGVKMRRAWIELALQRHEKVIYRGLRGNHDPEAQMWLSIALSEFFENNPRVDIDIDPGDFWAYEFGKTFLFANHGHKIKPELLPGLMAADYPDIWGRTKYRYAFSGHIHKERSGEALRTRWEALRTPTPGDNYAHTGGWRSGHELTSITYSAEIGQRHRQYVPV
jgi:hypothetical protein